MRCSDVERLLPQYADNALPMSQSDGIDAHLADCSACRGELAQLQRSMDALHLAAREPAPDLWAQFQTRLAETSGASCCRDIQALLPQFTEGELDRAQTLRVRDHLVDCAACAALEAEHSLPLRTLDRVAAKPAAVELWPAFAARLGESLSCREVEALLPAMLAGESSIKTLPFQSHVHACRACADSLAAYETSLGALSRVAQSVPEVDLWPAFVARLEREPAPRRSWSGVAAWLPALGTWLRGPLLQPALGLAAFALITLAGQMVSQSVAGRLRGTDLARLARSGAGQVAANQPSLASPPLAAVTAPSSLASASEGVRGTADVPASSSQRGAVAASVNRPRLTAVAKGPVNDGGSELPGKPQAPGVRVAFNLPAAGGEVDPTPENAFAPELTTGTPGSERDGMQAVVQVVGLLAGNEDALNSPFDSKANDK